MATAQSSALNSQFKPNSISESDPDWRRGSYQPRHPTTPFSSSAKRPFSALRDVKQFHDVQFADEPTKKIFRPWISQV